MIGEVVEELLMAVKHVSYIFLFIYLNQKWTQTT